MQNFLDFIDVFCHLLAGRKSPSYFSLYFFSYVEPILVTKKKTENKLNIAI